MAVSIMTRKDAELRLANAKMPRDINGGYLIIDALEALGLLYIEQDRIVVDITDANPVIIKRNGKIVYKE